MIRTIILASAILVFGCASLQATASGYSYEDGNGLARRCRGDSNFDRGVCHSYLVGIRDAQGSFACAGLLPARHFCPPEGVEVGALEEAFLTYVTRRPDNLHRTASSLVIDAFRIAFPCS